MLRPTAIQVEAVCEYKILVEFDNGEKKYFDVCKCQYKNVVFLSYKNVGKPTFLYDIFNYLQSYIASDLSFDMKDH